MEATSLFVISLDRRRERYRYHALFREFLLGELSRTEPDAIVTLHQRAADWYEALDLRSWPWSTCCTPTTGTARRG